MLAWKGRQGPCSRCTPKTQPCQTQTYVSWCMIAKAACRRWHKVMLTLGLGRIDSFRFDILFLYFVLTLLSLIVCVASPAIVPAALDILQHMLRACRCCANSSTRQILRMMLTTSACAITVFPQCKSALSVDVHSALSVLKSSVQ